jgi:cytochrome c peroxidase
VLATQDGSFAAAEMFSDSVSLIRPVLTSDGEASSNHELAQTQPLVTRIPLGTMRRLTPEERGEVLFFDARLSHDGWMSCHSCHSDGHSSGQLNDNLSDGSFGSPKRVLSLLGVGDTRPWGWNGSMQSLEQQIASTIKNTMQGEELAEQDVAALVSYLKTLSPPPVLESGAAPAHLASGQLLFGQLGCARCHAPPQFTSESVVDVELVDEQGQYRFNPPSLRGVTRRTNLFHDNRAQSLRDVFAVHAHQLPRPLTAEEQDSLLTYLRSL